MGLKAKGKRVVTPVTLPEQVTRTREKSPPAVVAGRVDEIATIMRAGGWRRGYSAPRLADQWGLAVATVEGMAAEAWRRVCAESNDAETVRPTIAGTLATSMADAHASREFRAVAQLADVYSKVVGARAAERVEHAHVVAEFERLPPKAQAKWLRERAARMLEAADRLENDVRGGMTG